LRAPQFSLEGGDTPGNDEPGIGARIMPVHDA
jgi:hypothetical protein